MRLSAQERRRHAACTLACATSKCGRMHRYDGSNCQRVEKIGEGVSRWRCKNLPNSIFSSKSYPSLMSPATMHAYTRDACVACAPIH
eukprot:6191537-Pleurochrysis_carterae.AAC.2